VITAVDTNVLIDLLGPTTPFTPSSVAALDESHQRGALIVSPIVVSELASYARVPNELRQALERMHLSLIAFSWIDLHLAGLAYVRFTRQSTRPKTRVLADFLIAAHAVTHADTLLTRDRGYYRTYFPKLVLIEP
jgi:predicted nucleic acid-binding protein